MTQLVNPLPSNRSIPPATVIPVLPYPSVRQAVEWLCDVFGFRERLRIAEHRAQLVFGGGAVIVAEYIDPERRPLAGVDHVSHLVMVRIDDVQRHYEHVLARGAEVLKQPVDHFYGERQYEVRDIGGHRWTFSQTLFDADPAEWGGPDVQLIGEPPV
jgi:uncharacterized glyoxalase superfamily protein PhnB